MSLRYEALTSRVTLIDGKICWRDGPKAGCPIALTSDKDGYKIFSLKFEGKYYCFREHRALWRLHYGEWPKNVIDHINAIKDDNRLENLRDVTVAENLAARNFAIDPEAGICWHKQKRRWSVQITRGRWRYFSGYLDTYEEALAHRRDVKEDFRIAAASPLSRGKGRTSHNSLGVRPNLHRKASV